MASVWIEKRGARHMVVWREPGTGRRRTRGGFTRKREAEDYRDKVRVSILTGEYLAEDDRQTPFGDYATRLVAAQGDLAPSTRLRYLSHISRHAAGLAAEPLSSITPARLRTFFSGLEAAGMGAPTRDLVRIFLSKVFRQAVREGLVPRNPVEGLRIRSVAAGRHEVDPLTHREAGALLRALSGPYDVMAELALYGGLRAGEIAVLTREDLDAHSDVVHIRATLQTVSGGHRRAPAPKTAASRRQVKISHDITLDILAWTLTAGPGPGGRIFSTPAGGWVRAAYLSNAMKAACKAARIRPRRFHDLRHTHAAWLIEQGVHPKKIQSRLGHSSISITLNVYGHLFPDAEDELVAALEVSRSETSSSGGKVVSLT